MSTVKYTHYYDKHDKLVATLATDHSNGVFRAGLAVAKGSEPIVSKGRGRQIAFGRLSEKYSISDIPNKKVQDHNGNITSLSDLVKSTIEHSESKININA